jgi:hypothetical protein
MKYIALTMAFTFAALAQQPARWVLLGRTAEGGTYYDRETVRYHSSKDEPKCDCYVVVWVRFQHVINYETALWEVHKTSHRIRVLAVAAYKDDGTVIRSSNEPGQWEELIPESAGEHAYHVFFPAEGK